jgi:hypothetical protein
LYVCSINVKINKKEWQPATKPLNSFADRGGGGEGGARPAKTQKLLQKFSDGKRLLHCPLKCNSENTVYAPTKSVYTA